jgi:hypothetical protein
MMSAEEFGMYYFQNLARIQKIIDALEAGDHDKALERAKWAYERAKGPSND